MWEEVAQMPLLTYFFLGWSGWPWVGEFDGFMIIFVCFPNPTEIGVSQTP